MILQKKDIFVLSPFEPVSLQHKKSGMLKNITPLKIEKFAMGIALEKAKN